jgi:hypothetical protein
VIPYIISTIALIGICFLTGEKPKPLFRHNFLRRSKLK